MSYREMAYQLVDIIPEVDLKCVVAFMQGLLAGAEQQPSPNDITLRVIEESRAGIGLSKGFSSVSELMEDLNADD